MTESHQTEGEGAEESFFSHLIELRSRLIRIIAVLLIVFFALISFARDLYTFFAQPMIDELQVMSGQMIVTDIVGGFMVPMKLTMLVSFIIVLPYVIYQIWAFVAPGLYVHEKKIAIPVIVSSVILFFIGMAFAYFVFFPAVFHFMAKFMPNGVAWMTDIEKYLSFVMTMFLAFGVVFEVPIVVLVMVKMGVVSVDKLKEMRSYVIVGAFAMGAVFAPPDVISQFMLAIPLCLLYEVGVFLARFVAPDTASEKEKTVENAAENPE